eukprot:6211941-Pleurochrysis_carterae.AAC.6
MRHAGVAKFPPPRGQAEAMPSYMLAYHSTLVHVSSWRADARSRTSSGAEKLSPNACALARVLS